MIDKLKSILKQILDYCNFLDKDEQLSISNITVAVFVLITAVRMAFGGSVLNISTFKWNIQTIDVSGTLPVLYSLLNYSHKRHINSKFNSSNSSESDK